MLEETHKYDDIINLPHPVSHRKTHISDEERAGQFAPFKALTGLEDEIDEVAGLNAIKQDMEHETFYDD